MKKIGIADNQALKFDASLKEHWEKKGHEVKYEFGASEVIFQWCDLYYVNFFDNNIHYLYKWHKDNPNIKKPTIVVRALDWDVWCGLARDPEMALWIDKVITITPHIKKKLLAENTAYKEDKVALIRCGVNLEKFTFKKSFGGYNIVIPCSEIDWHLKNVSEGFKIFAMLKKKSDKPWKLFVRGKWCQAEYFKVFHEDLIDKLGIRDDTTLTTSPVPDFNQYLEQMDYCLHPSYKEAFSYATGECAAKGIIPVLNHWYGAEDTWPKEWLYNTPDEAVEKILNWEKDKKMADVERAYCRSYMENHYSLEKMCSEYDRILGT